MVPYKGLGSQMLVSSHHSTLGYQFRCKVVQMHSVQSYRFQIPWISAQTQPLAVCCTSGRALTHVQELIISSMHCAAHRDVLSFRRCLDNAFWTPQITFSDETFCEKFVRREARARCPFELMRGSFFTLLHKYKQLR